MRIEDELLPAAVHLTGPEAIEVLRPAVAAAGGELLDCRIEKVQYRPHRSLTVRYRGVIRTGAVEASTVLLAGTTLEGAPAGTLPVEAETPEGHRLQVGVWRWPFDPVLGVLEELVTPRRAAVHLGSLLGGTPRIEVRVYRPGERAVLRAEGPRGEIYVKVVSEATLLGLIERHATLRRAGLPVPEVLARGAGWLAMTAMEGVTLRERLREPGCVLPPPERITGLLEGLAEVRIEGAPPVRSRRGDALHHAAMLGAVLPAGGGVLGRILDSLGDVPTPDAAQPTVHGDLHDAQILLAGDEVVGLLDIDDAGPGDRLDDLGTLLAHLEYQASVMGEIAPGALARDLRSAWESSVEPVVLDRHVAAVLVGLATGPFRHQQIGWEATTLRVLELAERVLNGGMHR